MDAKSNAPALTSEELEAAGNALFGERWQTPMTQALDLTDSSRIRQWMTRRRPMPAGIRNDVVRLLRARSAETAALADKLEIKEPATASP